MNEEERAEAERRGMAAIVEAGMAFLSPKTYRDLLTMHETTRNAGTSGDPRPPTGITLEVRQWVPDGMLIAPIKEGLPPVYASLKSFFEAGR